jgi:hypothetical protein
MKVHVWETKVLDVRPKLLRLHMSGSATHPYLPNRQTEEQIKKIYYMTWDMPWEETKHALSPSSVIFGVKT